MASLSYEERVAQHAELVKENDRKTAELAAPFENIGELMAAINLYGESAARKKAGGGLLAAACISLPEAPIAEAAPQEPAAEEAEPKMARSSSFNDMRADRAYEMAFKDAHDNTPILSLKDALRPTFQLFRKFDGYKPWKDEDFLAVIDEALAEMTTRIQELGLTGKYPVEKAAGINIYTRQTPEWFYLMNDIFNDAQHRTVQNELSEEVKACLYFSKFLQDALESLPEEFVYRGDLTRGTVWIYPSPLDHDPRRHFVGKVLTNFCWKSASTDSIMVQEQFAGKVGIRTIFTYRNVVGYKISKFSKFAKEAEVLLPPFSHFKGVEAVKLILAHIDPGDDAESVREDAFKKSTKHKGNPDVVILEQIHDQ